ncbi:hypothetical protein H5123_01130 [Shewanella sp. SR43-4]|jgi:hypothetical protein|uniref:DUF2231 domain-containing protein n=1 Tax=Shewanella vesiculosa TaxID=518738 RepID=A0ABV0FQ10_9GAMM|nr:MULTISPECIES: hypothetical protein [Shewanella]NCQ45305.1 hypothetical protein [Shewanella frigidimarina]MBB1316249.1 hypothetical protein [Shewanella sp. SR43-4]MBB1321001.1 hypothetical protein [Shewanella sp. SR43-8]MBB1475389.1 hypothetical protein [Shewanella sp. SG41-3]NCO70707.1 hypothetical protein [Shewanella vesiculosa]|tara:strand:+ start:3794 stop:4210 length:417 start_codon:yes stop_codon:yes gene_type:complete
MSSQSDPRDWKNANKQNTARLAKWTFAWVITMAIANFGPIYLWQQQAITALAIGINFIIGIGMIMANRRQLLGLDELQQKIQLHAMGLSLGVGLIVGLSYSNLDTTNLISGHAEISHLVIIMSLSYLVGIILGHRKYQ